MRRELQEHVPALTQAIMILVVILTHQKGVG
jgi:hypothetical protein